MDDIERYSNYQFKRGSLKEMLHFDALTGLYNRGTTEYLICKVIETEGPDALHAMIVLDLDNFRTINDDLGNQFGDQVLANTAKRLQTILRNSDIVGRIGGDEFVILLKDIKSPETAAQKAEEIGRIIGEAHEINEHTIQLSSSMGIAFYPFDGVMYETLFEKANISLYEDKRKGKEGDRKSNKPNLRNYENQLVKYAFDLMGETKDADDAIKQLLGKIGTELDLSRVYIGEFIHECDHMEISYDWHKQLVPSITSFDINTYTWKQYIRKYYENGIFICSDCTDAGLPEAFRELYDCLGIKSQISSLIVVKGVTKGCISFDSCKEMHAWTQQEIEVITTLSDIIGEYLLNMRTVQQLENERRITEAMPQDQNVLTFVFEPKSHNLIYMSPNLKQIFPNARAGESCYQAFASKDGSCQICPIRMESGDVVEVFNDKVGWWLSSSASEIEFKNGQKARVISMTDITDFRERMVSTDALTGVSSFTKFGEDINSLFEENNDEHYALMFTDFDKFKYINEEQGYNIGNRVLISFAKLCSSLLTEQEYICRYSSDIFITLIKYQDLDGLNERLINVYRKIDEWKKSHFSGFTISVISGIYLVQPEDRDISTILDKANMARKSIKGSHNRPYAFYDDKLHEQIIKEERIELLMEDALANQEFIVYLQPKVNLMTEQIIGAEALVRWQRPNGKMITPNDFIPLFEKNGFIKQLDFYIYEQVFGYLRKRMDEGKSVVPISVNVSGVHINDEQFVPNLTDLLNQYQIPPRMIELELTESIFIGALDELIKTLNKLKDAGFIFSIDDFGSGYSSLNLLRHLPIDIMKLDKCFFDAANITKITPKEKAVLSNIIRLGKDLDILVLSEGVETKEQADFLREFGCDLAQGYLFARPMPLAEFNLLLEK
ncbi:EAL domain-containing protein [Paenibacillus albiflavus]|uniref:EAL domain-containing protein n=1 Tax=Paenibacillus albiflavus TaxID=2545760 RepID=A0A4R4ENJ2_9BACL|nr:EAL domain-containing protein [Paenibacillus albiflavus]TCZ80101.1 EAL domain-containing protein [Paenibacillus albiflavus]